MFDKQFLTSIVSGNSSSHLTELSSVIGRLKDLRSIILDADFNNYGSGYCSYVPIYFSKRDKADVQISKKGNLTTHTTNGVVFYLCRNAPYATFGKGEWSKTFEGDKLRNGSIPYINEIGSLPSKDWEQRIIEIADLLNSYGIGILTAEELNVKLDFDIVIPTVFSSPGAYRVFDCFFHWED